MSASPWIREGLMAKTSQVMRDRRREVLIEKYAAKRAELRKKLKDPTFSMEEKLELQKEFAKLPRNSCPTRLNRRCAISGRSRGYYRKFDISRIALRDQTDESSSGCTMSKNSPSTGTSSNSSFTCAFRKSR